MFPVINTEKYGEKMQLATTYKQAGLIALAELTEARIIIQACTERKIPVYSEDPWGVFLYPTSRPCVGKTVALSEYTGTIPIETVNAIINSGLKPEKLAILNFQTKIDPALVFRFYSGIKTFSVRDHGYGSQIGELFYYMELANWE